MRIVVGISLLMMIVAGCSSSPRGQAVSCVDHHLRPEIRKIEQSFDCSKVSTHVQSATTFDPTLRTSKITAHGCGDMRTYIIQHPSCELRE